MGSDSLLNKAIKAATEVVNNEAAALSAITPVIGSDDFRNAVKILLEAKGSIVVVGMGKSGLVAQKMAATFTSTGTTARPLHAADALHGDLGAVGADDVVVIISKSGETKESLLIIPFLKEQKNRIVAITNESGSTLAKQAEVFLPMGVGSEACPLNLAPMTSTTVTMAIGDALAAALIVAKDFKAGDFAKFHPGGKLGWLLNAKVSDMIDLKNNPVLGESASLKEAVVTLVETRLGGVSITDQKGKLTGVITDGDLKRVMLDEEDGWQTKKVVDIMHKNPVSISPETSGADALSLMERRDSQISVLPVVDNDNKPVGMLRLHDVIQTYL